MYDRRIAFGSIFSLSPTLLLLASFLFVSSRAVAVVVVAGCRLVDEVSLGTRLMRRWWKK